MHNQTTIYLVISCGLEGFIYWTTQNLKEAQEEAKRTNGILCEVLNDKSENDIDMIMCN